MKLLIILLCLSGCYLATESVPPGQNLPPVEEEK